MGVIVNGTKFSSENKYVVSQNVTETSSAVLSTEVIPSGTRAGYLNFNTGWNTNIIYHINTANLAFSQDLTFKNLVSLDINNASLFEIEDLKIRYWKTPLDSASKSWGIIPYSNVSSGLQISFSLQNNSSTEGRIDLVITFTMLNPDVFGGKSGYYIGFWGFEGKLKYNGLYAFFKSGNPTVYGSSTDGYYSTTTNNDMFNSNKYIGEQNTYVKNTILNQGDEFGEFLAENTTKGRFAYAYLMPSSSSASGLNNGVTGTMETISFVYNMAQGVINYD